MNLKHEKLIQECIAQSGIVTSEKAIRYCDLLLSLADCFEDLGRKHKAEGAPALSGSDFEEISKRKFHYFPEAAEEFGKLLETYYISGYGEDGAWRE